MGEVLAVPLTWDGPEHIVLDGHHRGRGAQEVGRLTVPAVVFQADSELGPYLEEYRWWSSLNTVEEVREKWQRGWARDVPPNFRLSDMTVKNLYINAQGLPTSERPA